jgi:hypothetical protein
MEPSQSLKTDPSSKAEQNHWPFKVLAQSPFPQRIEPSIVLTTLPYRDFAQYTLPLMSVTH